MKLPRRGLLLSLIPFTAKGEEQPTLEYRVSFKCEKLIYQSGFTFKATLNPVQVLFVTRNGLVMLEGLDYTRSENSITFTTLQTVSNDDIVQMGYFG